MFKINKSVAWAYMRSEHTKMFPREVIAGGTEDWSLESYLRQIMAEL